MAYDKGRGTCVSTWNPVFVSIKYPAWNSERLANEANQQISCCQTTIEEFGRRMKGRFFVKGNKDERISNKCCDGEENVDCCERKWFLSKSTHQRGRACQFFKCFRLCSSSCEIWYQHYSVNRFFLLTVYLWLQQEIFCLNNIRGATITENLMTSLIISNKTSLQACLIYIASGYVLYVKEK